MKAAIRKIRPSPNEEARILQEERERRRKLRLQQVREQSKQSAAKIRDAVRIEKERLMSDLALKLQVDFENERLQKLEHLEEVYSKNLHNVGQGHILAHEWDPKAEEKAKEEKENARMAAKRHRKALQELQKQQEVKFERENRHLFARQAAIGVEKLRSMEVAARPPPPPDPIQDVEEPRVRPVKLTDLNAFSSTHYHINRDYAVEKAQPLEQTDAYMSAENEGEKLWETENAKKLSKHEQREMARVRFINARNKELLKQDYEQIMHDLSDLQRLDKQRRQQAVAKIPKQIFVAPHQRIEQRADTQRSMERQFEDMYMAATDFAGDVSLALEPHPAPDTPTGMDSLDLSAVNESELSAKHALPRSEEQTLPTPHSPVPGREVIVDAPEQGIGLRKLLNRIKAQRDDWVTKPHQDRPETERQRMETADNLLDHLHRSASPRDRPASPALPDKSTSPPTKLPHPASTKSGGSETCSLSQYTLPPSEAVFSAGPAPRSVSETETLEMATLPSSIGSSKTDNLLIHPMEQAAQVRKKEVVGANLDVYLAEKRSQQAQMELQNREIQTEITHRQARLMVQKKELEQRIKDIAEKKRALESLHVQGRAQNPEVPVNKADERTRQFVAEALLQEQYSHPGSSAHSQSSLSTGPLTPLDQSYRSQQILIQPAASHLIQPTQQQPVQLQYASGTEHSHRAQTGRYHADHTSSSTEERTALIKAYQASLLQRSLGNSLQESHEQLLQRTARHMAEYNDLKVKLITGPHLHHTEDQAPLSSSTHTTDSSSSGPDVDQQHAVTVPLSQPVKPMPTPDMQHTLLTDQTPTDYTNISSIPYREAQLLATGYEVSAEQTFQNVSQFENSGAETTQYYNMMQNTTLSTPRQSETASPESSTPRERDADFTTRQQELRRQLADILKQKEEIQQYQDQHQQEMDALKAKWRHELQQFNVVDTTVAGDNYISQASDNQSSDASLLKENLAQALNALDIEDDRSSITEADWEEYRRQELASQQMHTRTPTLQYPGTQAHHELSTIVEMDTPVSEKVNAKFFKDHKKRALHSAVVKRIDEMFTSPSLLQQMPGVDLAMAAQVQHRPAYERPTCRQSPVFASADVEHESSIGHLTQTEAEYEAASGLVARAPMYTAVQQQQFSGYLPPSKDTVAEASNAGYELDKAQYGLPILMAANYSNEKQQTSITGSIADAEIAMALVPDIVHPELMQAQQTPTATMATAVQEHHQYHSNMGYLKTPSAESAKVSLANSKFGKAYEVPNVILSAAIQEKQDRLSSIGYLPHAKTESSTKVSTVAQLPRAQEMPGVAVSALSQEQGKRLSSIGYLPSTATEAAWVTDSSSTTFGYARQQQRIAMAAATKNDSLSESIMGSLPSINFESAVLGREHRTLSRAQQTRPAAAVALEKYSQRLSSADSLPIANTDIATETTVKPQLAKAKTQPHVPSIAMATESNQLENQVSRVGYLPSTVFVKAMGSVVEQAGQAKAQQMIPVHYSAARVKQDPDTSQLQVSSPQGAAAIFAANQQYDRAYTLPPVTVATSAQSCQLSLDSTGFLPPASEVYGAISGTAPHLGLKTPYHMPPVTVAAAVGQYSPSHLQIRHIAPTDVRHAAAKIMEYPDIKNVDQQQQAIIMAATEKQKLGESPVGYLPMISADYADASTVDPTKFAEVTQACPVTVSATVQHQHSSSTGYVASPVEESVAVAEISQLGKALIMPAVTLSAALGQQQPCTADAEYLPPSSAYKAAVTQTASPAYIRANEKQPMQMSAVQEETRRMSDVATLAAHGPSSAQHSGQTVLHTASQLPRVVVTATEMYPVPVLHEEQPTRGPDPSTWQAAVNVQQPMEPVTVTSQVAKVAVSALVMPAPGEESGVQQWSALPYDDSLSEQGSNVQQSSAQSSMASSGASVNQHSATSHMSSLLSGPLDDTSDSYQPHVEGIVFSHSTSLSSGSETFATPYTTLHDRASAEQFVPLMVSPRDTDEETQVPTKSSETFANVKADMLGKGSESSACMKGDSSVCKTKGGPSSKAQVKQTLPEEQLADEFSMMKVDSERSFESSSSETWKDRLAAYTRPKGIPGRHSVDPSNLSGGMFDPSSSHSTLHKYDQRPQTYSPHFFDTDSEPFKRLSSTPAKSEPSQQPQQGKICAKGPSSKVTFEQQVDQQVDESIKRKPSLQVVKQKAHECQDPRQRQKSGSFHPMHPDVSGNTSVQSSDGSLRDRMSVASYMLAAGSPRESLSIGQIQDATYYLERLKNRNVQQTQSELSLASAHSLTQYSIASDSLLAQIPATPLVAATPTSNTSLTYHTLAAGTPLSNASLTEHSLMVTQFSNASLTQNTMPAGTPIPGASLTEHSILATPFSGSFALPTGTPFSKASSREHSAFSLTQHTLPAGSSLSLTEHSLTSVTPSSMNATPFSRASLTQQSMLSDTSSQSRSKLPTQSEFSLTQHSMTAVTPGMQHSMESHPSGESLAQLSVISPHTETFMLHSVLPWTPFSYGISPKFTSSRINSVNFEHSPKEALQTSPHFLDKSDGSLTQHSLPDLIKQSLSQHSLQDVTEHSLSKLSKHSLTQHTLENVSKHSLTQHSLHDESKKSHQSINSDLNFTTQQYGEENSSKSSSKLSENHSRVSYSDLSGRPLPATHAFLKMLKEGRSRSLGDFTDESISQYTLGDATGTSLTMHAMSDVSKDVSQQYVEPQTLAHTPIVSPHHSVRHSTVGASINQQSHTSLAQDLTGPSLSDYQDSEVSVSQYPVSDTLQQTHGSAASLSQYPQSFHSAKSVSQYPMNSTSDSSQSDGGHSLTQHTADVSHYPLTHSMERSLAQHTLEVTGNSVSQYPLSGSSPSSSQMSPSQYPLSATGGSMTQYSLSNTSGESLSQHSLHRTLSQYPISSQSLQYQLSLSGGSPSQYPLRDTPGQSPSQYPLSESGESVSHYRLKGTDSQYQLSESGASVSQYPIKPLETDSSYQISISETSASQHAVGHQSDSSSQYQLSHVSGVSVSQYPLETSSMTQERSLTQHALHDTQESPSWVRIQEPISNVVRHYMGSGAGSESESPQDASANRGDDPALCLSDRIQHSMLKYQHMIEESQLSRIDASRVQDYLSSQHAVKSLPLHSTMKPPAPTQDEGLGILDEPNLTFMSEMSEMSRQTSPQKSPQKYPFADMEDVEPSSSKKPSKSLLSFELHELSQLSHDEEDFQLQDLAKSTQPSRPADDTGDLAPSTLHSTRDTISLHDLDTTDQTDCTEVWDFTKPLHNVLTTEKLGGASVAASQGASHTTYSSTDEETGSEDGNKVYVVETPKGKQHAELEGLSLQEAFERKKREFIKSSEQRKAQAKVASSKSKTHGTMSRTLSAWKRSRALNGAGKTGAVSLTKSPGKSSATKTASDRKKEEQQMKQRTQRLYLDLEEVKTKMLDEERKKQYAKNREKAKEYQQKYQKKICKKK